MVVRNDADWPHPLYKRINPGQDKLNWIVVVVVVVVVYAESTALIMVGRKSAPKNTALSQPTMIKAVFSG